jgi:hypothetical protein
VRATTNPSPPLLPRPQSTATRMVSRFSNDASMAATTWRPAFSMSTIDGMPMSSIVRRSASRIWRVLNTRTGARDARDERIRLPDRAQCHAWRFSARRGYTDRMSAVVYVNGTIAARRPGVDPVFDHGFLYGEGIYETLRTYDRRAVPVRSPHAAAAHSAALMALTCRSATTTCARACARPWPRTALTEAYIRIL